MITWLRKMLEDANGIPDEARVGAMILIATYAGNSVAAVVMNATHEFNMQQFGIGASALAVGIGAWLGLRKDN